MSQRADESPSGSAPAPGSRSRRGADRRRAILAAALEVFAAKGYARASMAEIASRVGIVEGALYKHFAGKRELLFETTRAYYAPLIERLRRELSGVRGTRNRLRFVIGRQLESFAEQPGICRLIIEEIRPQGDYYESVVRELNRESTSLALGILQQAERAGELRAGVDPTLVRDVIYGGIEHLAWKALAGRGSIDVERLADGLTDLILVGVMESNADSEAAADSMTNKMTNDELKRLREQVDRLAALVARLEGGSEPS